MTTYNILNPHPKVMATYDEAGWYPSHITFQENGSEEMTILNAIANGKQKKVVAPWGEPILDPYVYQAEDDEKVRGPLRREIHKMYRIQSGDKENFVYVESLTGNLFKGDEVSVTRIVGKYKAPKLVQSFDTKTATKKVTGQSGFIETFEIPFNDKSFTDPSTNQKTTIAELAKMRTGGCKYYVKTADRTYGLPGLSFEEFTEKSFGELVEYGKTGKWPESKPKKGKVESDG